MFYFTNLLIQVWVQKFVNGIRNMLKKMKAVVKGNTKLYNTIKDECGTNKCTIESQHAHAGWPKVLLQFWVWYNFGWWDYRSPPMVDNFILDSQQCLQKQLDSLKKKLLQILNDNKWTENLDCGLQQTGWEQVSL